MDIFDKELLDLFTTLEKNNVRYLLVGGFATNLHGYQRTTGDIDIWLDDSLANRRALRQAFEEAGLGDLPELETVPFLAGYTTIILDSGFTLDLMSAIKGFTALDFQNCYDMAAVHHVYNTSIRFLHFNHLLHAKQASGRPKDLLDILELEKIHKRDTANDE